MMKSPRATIKPPGAGIDITLILVLSQLESGENVGPCLPPWSPSHTSNAQQMYTIPPSLIHILLCRLLYTLALLKWWQSQGRTSPTANSLRSKNYDSGVHRFLSDTLAFSLRLMPSQLATGALSTRPGSSAASPSTPPPCGPIPSTCPPRLDLYYVHLQ